MVLTWANEAQLKFLRSRRPAFRKHQEEGTVAFFWVEVAEEWFVLWPDQTYDDGKSWLAVSGHILATYRMRLTEIFTARESLVQ